MKQIYGVSVSGNMEEAIRGISNPSALVFATTAENLEKHAKELEEAFPGVPSIGGVGQGYGDAKTNDNGVTVIALSDGIKATANVIEELSVMPVKYIRRVEDDLEKVSAQSDNTVCFDFCTGNDSRLITSLHSILSKKKISLVGGTSNSTSIAMNGKIYEDACAYLMIKNERGKVKVYKENIYKPMLDNRMIATKTEPRKYMINEIDNKPAEKVYCNLLGISKEDAKTQTFKNPMGRCYGNEVYLISIKQVVNGSLECYRQITNMDVLTMTELDDYKQVVQNTLSKMQSDFSHISAILSVNCLFRYLFFHEEHYWDDYLKAMCSISTHAGMVGMGEHYKNQHVNQTMCCVVFE